MNELGLPLEFGKQKPVKTKATTTSKAVQQDPTTQTQQEAFNASGSNKVSLLPCLTSERAETVMTETGMLQSIPKR
jgi:hypothetical protein